MLGGVLTNNDVTDAVYTLNTTALTWSPARYSGTLKPRGFSTASDGWLFGGLVVEGDVQMNDLLQFTSE